MNKLSIYDWHLYPKVKAFIQPGKIVASGTCEFMIAWSSDDAPRPILIPLWEMTLDHAGTFVGLGKEPFSMVYVKRVGEVGITAQVQPRTIGKTSRKIERLFPFETFTPAQFKFLLEREYDVFGWIDKGLALTLHQAEDLVWRNVSKEVSIIATNEDAYNGPDNRDYSLDEMALYQNPIIAEAQTGMQVLICEPKEDDGLTIVEEAAPYLKSFSKSLQKLEGIIERERNITNPVVSINEIWHGLTPKARWEYIVSNSYNKPNEPDIFPDYDTSQGYSIYDLRRDFHIDNTPEGLKRERELVVLFSNGYSHKQFGYELPEDIDEFLKQTM